MKICGSANPTTRLAATVATVTMAALVAACAGPQTPRFSLMPAPGQGEKPSYTAILGPLSGSGSKTFTVAARPGMAEWIGCIGKGEAWITKPKAVGAICDGGNAFAGGLTQPTHYRRGQVLTVRITAPPTVRWEFRIDGAPWTGQ